jgi:outer membrane receptor protein involved in Fe transport
MQRFFVLAFLLIIAQLAQAQPGGRPGGGPGGGPGMGAGIVNIYGKLLDEKGAGLAYATVSIWGKNPTSGADTLLTGALSQENGDFRIEKVPAKGTKLKVSYVGYETLTRDIDFQPSARGANDKDLGNLQLAVSAGSGDEVVVTAEGTGMTLALDKIIYRVDKNVLAAGGTGEDALRNIPTLSVDIDGNVTMRNSSPQIFIDGRPSTLTMDQIQADAIDRIEIIANPSAKYDASGGQAGIVNVVMKADRRQGFNGALRSGIDSRLGYNIGGEINQREKKWNVFLNGNVSQRNTKTTGVTNRQLLAPQIGQNDQTQEGWNTGFHRNGKLGIDWLPDNRNTFTLSGNLTGIRFNPLDSNIYTNSFLQPDGTTTTNVQRRYADFTREVLNGGGSLLYKHLYPKEGHELTADINYNTVRSEGNGSYTTRFEPDQTLSQERQTQLNTTWYLTSQIDYVKPMRKGSKIETGARVSLRDFVSDMANYRQVSGEWTRIAGFADQFHFLDKVYAGYLNYGRQTEKWGAQAGLRVESSFYTGELPENDTSFAINFPLSIFPSVFVTRKINATDQFQISVSRRIQRPTFFQLIPFSDFADSLEIKRGNPNLQPEFVTGIEASYFKSFKGKHTILSTIYFKQRDNLMIRYTASEFNADLNRVVPVVTYANVGSGQQYGLELVVKNNLLKFLELTSNFNGYQSTIQATAETGGINVSRFSYLIKENLSINLPKQWSVQLSGEYFSPSALSTDGGGGGGGSRGGGGGGGMWMQGPTSSVQGYTLAYWFMDIGVKKTLLDRKLTISLGVQDIFATRKQGNYTATSNFILDSERIRNPQMIKLNLNYKFGKQDQSLFRRKHNREEGGDMG